MTPPKGDKGKVKRLVYEVLDHNFGSKGKSFDSEIAFFERDDD